MGHVSVDALTVDVPIVPEEIQSGKVKEIMVRTNDIKQTHAKVRWQKITYNPSPPHPD